MIIKKILNISEILVLGFIVSMLPNFYNHLYSTPRYSTSLEYLRITIDIVFISIALFRIFRLIKNFNKQFSTYRKTTNWEVILYLLFTAVLLPDLYSFFRWFYYTEMYIYNFTLYLLPIIFWGIELVLRRKNSTPDSSGSLQKKTILQIP